MFEDLLDELERLNGQSISVKIESDEKGYLDRQCPNEDCRFIFKVKEEDWENIVKEGKVWCPFCRYEDIADKWITLKQQKHVDAEVSAVVEGIIHNSLLSGAKKFNRRQSKNSFLSMSVEVRGGIQRTHTIPAKAADLMQLEIQCEICKCRFAVIGSAYFCPACGYNSVTRMFRDSLRKIRVKKDNIDDIKKAMIESNDRDQAELICRSLVETCITDGVVAFQKYSEGMYESFGKVPKNAFQRLGQANELWKEAIKKGFDSWLTEAEINSLNILYQKRHLLAHSEGIIDAKYIQKSGDNTYNEGQRVVISVKDVDVLVSSLEKLASGIEIECKEK